MATKNLGHAVGWQYVACAVCAHYRHGGSDDVRAVQGVFGQRVQLERRAVDFRRLPVGVCGGGNRGVVPCVVELAIPLCLLSYVYTQFQ